MIQYVSTIFSPWNCAIITLFGKNETRRLAYFFLIQGIGEKN